MYTSVISIFAALFAINIIVEESFLPYTAIITSSILARQLNFFKPVFSFIYKSESYSSFYAHSNLNIVGYFFPYAAVITSSIQTCHLSIFELVFSFVHQTTAYSPFYAQSNLLNEEYFFPNAAVTPASKLYC